MLFSALAASDEWSQGSDSRCWLTWDLSNTILQLFFPILVLICGLFKKGLRYPFDKLRKLALWWKEGNLLRFTDFQNQPATCDILHSRCRVHACFHNNVKDQKNNKNNNFDFTLLVLLFFSLCEGYSCFKEIIFEVCFFSYHHILFMDSDLKSFLYLGRLTDIQNISSFSLQKRESIKRFAKHYRTVAFFPEVYSMDCTSCLL